MRALDKTRIAAKYLAPICRFQIPMFAVVLSGLVGATLGHALPELAKLKTTAIVEEDCPVELLDGTAATWGGGGSSEGSLPLGVLEVTGGLRGIEGKSPGEPVHFTVFWRNRAAKPVKSVDVAWVQIDSAGHQAGFSRTEAVARGRGLKPGKEVFQTFQAKIPLETRELKVIVLSVKYSDGQVWTRPQPSAPTGITP